MEDYKPNSHKYKEEQDAKKTVIKHGATLKKKNKAERLADIFIAEDMANVKEYVVGKIIVPRLKELAFKVISEGANMLILGGTGSTTRSSSDSRPVYTRYYSDEKRDKGSEPRRSAYDYRGILFDDRADAEEVLDTMNEIVDHEGAVSVADVCEMLRISSTYTDRKYGWDDLHSVRIIREGDGYTLKLPRVKQI